MKLCIRLVLKPPGKNDEVIVFPPGTEHRFEQCEEDRLDWQRTIAGVSLSFVND